MKDLTWDTLQIAKSKAENYIHVLSKDLQAVFDANSLTIIPSWRQDGHFSEIPLHGMMSRVGGFPPPLARYFIAAYTQVHDVVLDPFCGKGTTLVEAARLGRIAIGGDIAPDAVIVSRAKSNPLSIAEIVTYIEKLPVDKEITIRDVPGDVALFFSRKTLKQIISIRKYLFEELSSRSFVKKKKATFVCALLLGILHGKSRLSLSLPCNQCFGMSPGYVRKYADEHNLKRPDRDVKYCLVQKALEVLPFPKNMVASSVYEMSAEKCDIYMNLNKVKADLVLTSPPYLDRQTYLRDSWLRSWFLDRDWREIKKHSLETGNMKIFHNGMVQSLSAIWRSLKTGGRVVLVCGRAKTEVAGKKRTVKISDICLSAMDQMKQIGYPFKVDGIITDRILMKRGSYFAVIHAKGHNENGGSTKRYGEDEILILTK